MVYDRTGAAPVFLINMLTSTYEEQLAMLKYARSIGRRWSISRWATSIIWTTILKNTTT